MFSAALRIKPLACRTMVLGQQHVQRAPRAFKVCALDHSDLTPTHVARRHHPSTHVPYATQALLVSFHALSVIIMHQHDMLIPFPPLSFPPSPPPPHHQTHRPSTPSPPRQDKPCAGASPPPPPSLLPNARPPPLLLLPGSQTSTWASK